MTGPFPLAQELDASRSYTDLFRLVKRLVERRLGKSRAGIMLGLSSLGLSSTGFLGGYFVLGSNAIVLNRDVLHHIKAAYPESHNAYAFHVLLHEYLHTLGYLSEDDVRPIAYQLSREALGDDHPATVIAAALAGAGERGQVPEAFRKLVYPEFGWAPPGNPHIEIIKGFDPDATPYIG